MPKMKFKDIKVGQVYVTRGGIAVLNASGKTAYWGFDRVKVVKKNKTAIVVETPWGTLCNLPVNYPLYFTKEKTPRIEFKLITTYLTKQEFEFDEAVAAGICVEHISPADLKIEKILEDLIKYFNTPQTISSAAKKFGKTYQKIRYLISKIEKINKYTVKRTETSKGKIIQIKEENCGKST